LTTQILQLEHGDFVRDATAIRKKALRASGPYRILVRVQRS
jgi:hypothetical protein